MGVKKRRFDPALITSGGPNRHFSVRRQVPKVAQSVIVTSIVHAAVEGA
jgi:hypothetical protein